MFGAVECQKSNGSLHYHFFLFVQRLHQYCTVQEIAKILEEGLAAATDLKEFIANICCTSYSDLESNKNEVEKLEAHFPTYSERSECSNAEPVWGEVKLGRIPECFYADSRSASDERTHARSADACEYYIDSSSCNDAEKYRGVTNAHSAGNKTDPDAYEAKFARAFQYLQSRCQHHIHKLINGSRVVPNA